MKLIPLSQGKFAKVDDEDFAKLSGSEWYAHKGHSGFYAVRNGPRLTSGNQSTVYMHRVIMNAPIGSEVDHKNHDTLDNQKSNLRVGTKYNNMKNRRGAPKHSKSGIRGVYWFKSKSRWGASIQVDGKRIFLGLHDEKSSAASAYASANKKYFGDFGGGL